jgi:PAS domain S-box-containing protein
MYMKRTASSMIFLIFILCMFTSIFIMSGIIIAAAQEGPPQTKLLDPAEQQWLSEHDGLVRIGITEIPPQILRGKQEGEYRGLSIDYIHLLERNLRCKFQLVYYKTWNEVIQKARNKEIDIIFAAQKTPERSEYLLFSKPYIELPNVIIVRKNTAGSFSLDKMTGLKIACSKGSAVQEFLRERYGYLNIHPVEDEMSGLLKVSVGEVDAMVVEIARASYYIEKAQITNLRIAGNAGYKYELRFASRKDWPALNRILDKGLVSITDNDREAIVRRWVIVSNESLFASRLFWIAAAAGIAVILAVFAGALWWNSELKNQVEERTVQLQQELLERKRAEAEIRELSRKNEEALRVAHMGHWEFDVASGMFTFNDQYYTLHGATAREMGGYRMPAEEFARKYVSPDHAYLVGKSIQQAIESTDSNFQFQAEAAILRLDGEPRDVIVWFRVEKDAQGKTVKLHGVNQDITERKRVENALRESEFFLNKSQQVARIGSYKFEATTGTWICSQSLNEIFGIGPDYPKTVDGWLDLVAPEDREVMRNHLLQHVLAEHNRFDREYRIIRRNDGAERWMHGLGELEFDKNGNPLRMIGTIRDITERKLANEEQSKLKEQLFQSQKMETVGLLAGGVAHDFNNLLTPILGYSEILMLNLSVDDQNRSKIQQIKQSAERAKELIQRLLAFGRKQMLELKTVNLGDIISEFEQVLHRTIRENIRIEISITPLLGLVRADKGQIEQVLLNLSINAQDAMPSGGVLTIEAKNMDLDESHTAKHPEVVPGPYVMLAVSDTGTGMDEQTQKYIFDPFFTTKELGKGTGLGLSTVYGIVKQHSGSIYVYSEKNRGSVFRVFLPNVEKKGESIEGRPIQPADVARGVETVLVVEDNEMVRTLAQKMLEGLGYQVLVAKNADHCFEIAKHYGAINLLLTDVIMPALNGKELYELLKRDRPDLKVLFMSGYSKDVIGHHGVMDEGINFLQKPFTLSALSQKVRQVLES